MVNFEFYSPTRFFFGKEQHKNVGKILKEYGAKKILLLYYGQPYEEKLIGEITAALDEAGIAYLKFSGIKANPTYERAVEGTQIVKKEGIEKSIKATGATFTWGANKFDDLGDIAAGFKKVKDDNIARGMPTLTPLYKLIAWMPIVKRFAEKILIFEKSKDNE